MLVTAGGILLIGFIHWFFFMRQESVVAVAESVDIVVNGGYSPEAVSVVVGKELNLTFLRKDPSSCLEEVIFPDFGIRKYLPLNEKVTVTIRPTEKKNYSYSCGMNMFHGKIVAT